MATKNSHTWHILQSLLQSLVEILLSKMFEQTLHKKNVKRYSTSLVIRKLQRKAITVHPLEWLKLK